MTKLILIFGLNFIFYSCLLVDSNGEEKCPTMDPTKINVHLIPYSHSDLYRKTMGDIYFGSNKQIEKRAVQYVYDTVTNELLKNPNRTFVVDQIVYFWRWWSDQYDIHKENVRKLVANGQLVFAQGGWVPQDEATTHYSAMIDQMTLGLKFINVTFGESARPKCGWQVHNDGYSLEAAIHHIEMGFDGLFIGRVDESEKKQRMDSQTMEFVWRPDPSLGKNGDLFIAILRDMFYAPLGFCFDMWCTNSQNDPVLDDSVHGGTASRRIYEFQRMIESFQTIYKTNHILILMGDHLAYNIAGAWYNNIDRLIKYVHSNITSLNVVYSTPSCYLEALRSSDIKWTVKDEDDFFPLVIGKNEVSSGYFTTRPTLKFLAYTTNRIVQAVKQLATTIGTELQGKEFMSKTYVSLAQHHNLMSGACVESVASDTKRYLYEALEAGKEIVSSAYKKIYGNDYALDLDFCLLRNVSHCLVIEKGHNFIVTVYNQLSRHISSYVKFPAFDNVEYTVYDETGSVITVDKLPIPENLKNVPEKTSKMTHDVYFKAESIPPLGINEYYIELKSSSVQQTGISAVANPLILDNGILQLEFDSKTGLLKSVTKNSKKWQLQQNFFFYDSFDTKEQIPSGHVIFHPKQQNYPIMVSSSANISQYRGRNIFEVRQQFTSWLSQIVRLYNGSKDIEFEWLIDEIPKKYGGKELVTKYFTDIVSNDRFFTDSNGRRWVERVRYLKKYFNVEAHMDDPISRNYYPITTAVKILDDQKQLTVIVDRPEGVTSMKSGELEIMLHRRTLHDDLTGMEESLDETAFSRELGISVRGKHVVQFNELSLANESHRFIAEQEVFSPVVTFSETPLASHNEWLARIEKKFSLVQTALPSNVRILTLERWNPNEILLRLEHIFQLNEHPVYSQPAVVEIWNLFSHFQINSIRELSLGANIDKSNVTRLEFDHEGEQADIELSQNAFESDNINIVLRPMQIRTFLLYVEPWLENEKSPRREQHFIPVTKNLVNESVESRDFQNNLLFFAILCAVLLLLVWMHKICSILRCLPSTLCARILYRCQFLHRTSQQHNFV